MGTYTRIKCGYCKKNMTNGFEYGIDNSILGVSHRLCNNCNKYNSTGSKPYSKFNLYDKIYFYSNNMFLGLLFSFGIIFFSLMEIFKDESLNNYRGVTDFTFKVILICSILISCPITYFGIIKLKKSKIKEVENAQYYLNIEMSLKQRK